MQGQVGEDLAQPERGQPEHPEHLERMAELMECDEVEEGLEVQAACAVGVGREEPPEAAWRRCTKVLPDCHPEVPASGGHHEDARTNLTVVVREERQPL